VLTNQTVEAVLLPLSRVLEAEKLTGTVDVVVVPGRAPLLLKNLYFVRV
jgi:hypothetical protein